MVSGFPESSRDDFREAIDHLWMMVVDGGVNPTLHGGVIRLLIVVG
jgi:hypothetical protein